MYFHTCFCMYSIFHNFKSLELSSHKTFWNFKKMFKLLYEGLFSNHFIGNYIHLKMLSLRSSIF